MSPAQNIITAIDNLAAAIVFSTVMTSAMFLLFMLFFATKGRSK